MFVVIRKKTKRKDKRNGVQRENFNVPDDLDQIILNDEYQKFACKLDANNKPKPFTENHLKNIIRSAVRKKWMCCDVKLAFLLSRTVLDYDPNTRRRVKIQCDICKQWFTKTDVDVDHIKGEHSFTDLSQAHSWACDILDVGFDDLQILCNITCHPIKTLAEQNGITFEEASILRTVIAWENDKTINHKVYLTALGADESKVSNKHKRRLFYLDHLKFVDKTYKV